MVLIIKIYEQKKIKKKYNIYKIKYNDYIKFYKYCIVTQDLLINQKNKIKKIFIIKGIIEKNNIYKNYIQNWFFIFENYKHKEIQIAFNFFISLDEKNTFNLKWYKKYTKKIKSKLNKILIWWNLIKDKSCKTKWNIFISRFLALFKRIFYFLRKNY